MHYLVKKDFHNHARLRRG